MALRPGKQATESEIIEYVKERVASYKYPRSRWSSASTCR